MNSRIIPRRVRKIRGLLHKAKIESLLIMKAANVRYVTGFSGDDSWAVIGPETLHLITDSRYTQQAQSECPSCKIIERKGPIVDSAAAIIKGLKLKKSVGVESSCSIAIFESLKKKIKNRVRGVDNIVEQIRVIKDAGEIAAIQKAAAVVKKALKNILKDIRAGVSENQLAGKLDFQIRLLGAKPAFGTIVAFGANASRPHHQPGVRKLKKNDTILIDFGARYKGYCSDITRCFTIGRPDALYKKVYKAVKESHDRAIKMVKAGVEINKVDSAGRAVIAGFDFPVYGHGTGHGIGLEVHEAPAVTGKAKGKLEAGMVFTIEPGVYLAGKLGVRLEDDILVTKTGHRKLT